MKIFYTPKILCMSLLLIVYFLLFGLIKMKDNCKYTDICRLGKLLRRLKLRTRNIVIKSSLLDHENIVKEKHGFHHHNYI